MLKLVSKDMHRATSPLAKERSPMRGVQIARPAQGINTSQERMNGRVSLSPTSRNRIKIKVVSPLRKDIDSITTKENSPSHYTKTCNNSPSTSPPKINFTPILHNRPPPPSNPNDVSNLSIKQHFQPEPHRRPTPKYSNFVIMDSHHPSIKHKDHPQKICINNKPFDIGTIKSQIIYVAPFRHIRNDSKNCSNPMNSQGSQQNEGHWAPNHPSILEEIESESLKGSSKSKQSQPQQTTQEVKINAPKVMEQLNTCTTQEVCISELVFAEREEEEDKAVPKLLNFQDVPLHHSRMQSDNKIYPPIPTQKTLINELDFHTDKRLTSSIKKDAISVQTDRCPEPRENTNRSKLSKFAITKNLEYQIETKVEVHAERKSIEEVEEVEQIVEEETGKRQEITLEEEKCIITEEPLIAEKVESDANAQYVPQEKEQKKEEIIVEIKQEKPQVIKPDILIHQEPSISCAKSDITSQSSIISLNEPPLPLPQINKTPIPQETERLPFSARSNQSKEPASVKQLPSKKTDQWSTFSARSIKQPPSDAFTRKTGSKRSITNNIYR